MPTRREVLGGVCATSVMAVAGLPVSALASVIQAQSVVKMLPAWDVGSDDMNWQVIFAETKDQAQGIWYADMHGNDPDEPCSCGCGARDAYCEKHSEGLPKARRAKHWDNPENVEPTIAEMYRHDWTTCCDRCGNKVSRSDGESDVLPSEGNREDVVVCHDCMTDDELKSVFPDHWRFDPDGDVAVI